MLDSDGKVLATFNGTDVIASANGGQTDPNTNRQVLLTITEGDMAKVAKLRFRSSGNAFEFDNVAIQAAAVPGPASWALMIGGFGLAGAAMRRRRTALCFA